MAYNPVDILLAMVDAAERGDRKSLLAMQDMASDAAEAGASVDANTEGMGDPSGASAKRVAERMRQYLKKKVSARQVSEGCVPNKTGKGHHDDRTGHPCSPGGADEWQPHEGKRGGKGWKNTRTGKTVYGAKPGTDEHKAQEAAKEEARRKRDLEALAKPSQARIQGWLPEQRDAAEASVRGLGPMTDDVRRARLEGQPVAYDEETGRWIVGDDPGFDPDEDIADATGD